MARKQIRHYSKSNHEIKKPRLAQFTTTYLFHHWVAGVFNRHFKGHHCPFATQLLRCNREILVAKALVAFLISMVEKVTFQRAKHVILALVKSSKESHLFELLESGGLSKINQASISISPFILYCDSETI